MRLPGARPSVSGRRLSAVAAGLCVAVVVARMALALLTPSPELVFDAVGYDRSARRLAATGVLAYVPPDVAVEAPAANAVVLPGYPLFLGAIYGITGTDEPAQPVVSLVQAFLQGLAMWGVFLIARRMAGARPALVATALMAVYPPFWWSYRFVLTEDLFTLLCVWTGYAFIVAYQARKQRAWVPWIVLGGLGALAVLVRAAAGAWLVAAGATLLAMDRGSRADLFRGGAIAVVTLALCMVPWWVRNWAIYDAFVPLNTMTAGAGITLLVEDEQERERIMEPYALSFQEPKDELVVRDAMSRLTQQLQREAFSRDPAGFILLRLRAAVISVFTYHPNPFGGFTGWGGAVEALHLGILGMALVGTVRTITRRETWVLLALPLALLVTHTLTLIFSRYLFPMMPFVILLAAIGLACSRGSATDRTGCDGA